jgi:predicted MFS family arabinose efflux permease
VVAGLGVQTALLLDAGSFLLVAVVLLAARAVPSLKARKQPWQARLREGYSYVAQRPILRRLLAAQAVAYIFFAAVIPIEIVYAKDTLGAGDSGYGALLAGWGAGMVAGSVLFAATRRISLQILLLFSTLAVGISYLGLSATQTLLAACLVAAVGGAGNGVQWVSVMSAIQEMTASSYQARVVALLQSVGYAMPGLGFVLGGVVAQLLDPRATFFVAGAGVVLVVAAAAPLLRRTSWAPDRETPLGERVAPIELGEAPKPIPGP